ncbi:MAG: homoserine kinase, partial [Hyphomicrobiaceae bacterium]
MAVYTTVTDVELARFVHGHGLGELHSFKGIAEGVENTNYLVETDRGRFILTLYEKRVDAGDLPFFLGLMEHLASRGIACPQPVRDHSGSQIARLAGRPAAICTFLDGISVARPEHEHCALVGEALARLHLAGRDFSQRRANALGPAGWRPLFSGFSNRADEIRPGLARMIEDEFAALLPNWPTALPEGVIHADLFPDNVFFLGGRLSGIIDFYFACNDLLAYDIGVCIIAWCFGQDLVLDIDKARALLDGDRRIRPLGAKEHAA